MWHEGSMRVGMVSALREPHRAHILAGMSSGMYLISPIREVHSTVMCMMMCTLISINYDFVSLSWLLVQEKLM